MATESAAGGIAEPCGWWGVLPRRVGCSVRSRCLEGFGVGGGFPGLSAEGGASCRCATQPQGGWATRGHPAGLGRPEADIHAVR
jgi:hypothetical protein